jgi:hypothetical protein
MLGGGLVEHKNVRKRRTNEVQEKSKDPGDVRNEQ